MGGWARPTTARWACSPRWPWDRGRPWWERGCSCPTLGWKTRPAAAAPGCRSRRSARTKLALARALVAQAQADGLDFQWVGADAFYGRDQGWLCELDEQGLGFMVDVPCTTRVWTEPPAAGERPGASVAVGAGRVDEVGRRWTQPEAGQRVTLRVGENGPVALRVGVWPAGQVRPRSCWLVVRADADGARKYSLSNAPAQTSRLRLGRLQG